MKYSEKLQSIPPEILRAEDYSRLAEQFIPADILAYINGGAGDELTLQRNCSAFDSLQILPRVLRDFSGANTRRSLFGHTLQHPFLLGPVGHQKLVHAAGETATAQAAEAMHTGLIASTHSSVTLEDIAQHTNALKWFQLYWQPRRDDVLTLVQRAEQAGYTALVVTVDAPVTALRYREQRAGFSHPAELPAANLLSLGASPPIKAGPDDSVILNGIMREAPGWNDLDWLRRQTSLPVIIKGILNPTDALLAQQHGIRGIIVSNHGGRSLDGVPASIEVIADIRAAVGNDFPVLLDSGIRRGADIFKALALGADAALIGRLQLHALAVAGALGVAHMLRLLREELAVTMALAGCPTLSDIGPATVRAVTD